VGVDLFPGSLNVALKRPLRMNEVVARRFKGRHGLIWPASLNGMPVWVYRWQYAPLHVLEVLSTAHLRDSLSLADGDPVTIRINREQVDTVGWLGAWTWLLVWFGRPGWYYAHDRYASRTGPWCLHLGATQAPRVGGLTMIRRLLGKVPYASRVKRALFDGGSPSPHVFVRADAGNDFERIRNLLDYTKTSGASYSGSQYPAGYHSIEIGGIRLDGQRDPAKRLEIVPVDFTGTTVLDIGCNQGGMLFQLRDKLRQGIGLDNDHRMVNAANRIKASLLAGNLSFYVFDLEKEPLGLIRDFLPGTGVDIVFLLAVCMWITNWRKVIDFAATVSDRMLFETNGTDQQQGDQEQYLRVRYACVRLLSGSSDDDPGQKSRSLFWATNGE